MLTLHVAAGLAILSAAGHSFLSERLFLAPLRRKSAGGGGASGSRSTRLSTAMFHMASLCWLTLAASLLLLEPGTEGYRPTLHLFSALFAISGIGNFWAVKKLHPGGVMLLSAGLLILASLHT